MPLFDLTFPALKRMSRGQYAAFREQVERLIAADGQVGAFEYMLRSSLDRNVGPVQGQATPAAGPRPTPAERVFNVTRVLALVARAGKGGEADAPKAFADGMRDYLGGSGAVPPMPPASDSTVEKLDASLHVLANDAADERRRVLQACAACVASDGNVTVAEAELFRSVGYVLGCPVPPLLADA